MQANTIKAGRLEMAEEQTQELTIALQEKDRPAYPGLVTKIEFSIEVLRENLTLLQKALPPDGKRSPT
ncbi:hypothetical protein NKH19_30810 [Mesorhizobium sp. M1338]|uniref:hypothetical protein n=1 Tax=unclassified Mesorhizobium TaxID=325217 RepID=UPI0033384857